jgi:hypothetical protein
MLFIFGKLLKDINLKDINLKDIHCVYFTDNEQL